MSTVVIPNLPKSTVAKQKKFAKSKNKSEQFDKLIGPTDNAMDAKAIDKLKAARINLLIQQPFFGTLATYLQLVNADEWLATAATDGRKFYYNSRFINMLKPREVDFLFGHEVLHVVYDHMGRLDSRDKQLWNIAADYCVNADLKKHRVGEFITTVPCLYETKYDGKTAEYVYDDLFEKADKMDLQSLIDQMLDEHMEGGEGEYGESEGDGDGNKNGKGRPSAMTAEEKEQLRQDIRANVIQAAKNAEAGQVPANIERMIKDLTEPKINWRELLQADLTSVIKDNYSFKRVSRRGWHIDAILPGRMPAEEVDIVVAIDTSGSISDKQCRTFLSEINAIMGQYDAYKITVFCFDTRSYNQQEFTSDNLAQITDYEPKGGGGTDFDAIFNHLKKNEIEPVRLIVFTDGYPFGSWGDPNYCDTTWIIHGDKNPNPPFGQFAIYDET